MRNSGLPAPKMIRLDSRGYFLPLVFLFEGFSSRLLPGTVEVDRSPSNAAGEVFGSVSARNCCRQPDQRMLSSRIRRVGLYIIYGVSAVHYIRLARRYVTCATLLL